MIEPLIHAKTEGGSTEFLAELGGDKSLINLTGIETGHTGLNLLTIVSLGLSVDVAIHIIIYALVSLVKGWETADIEQPKSAEIAVKWFPIP